jgi:hypothetical protein
MKIMTQVLSKISHTVFAHICIVAGTIGALIMAVWAFGEDLLVLL